MHELILNINASRTYTINRKYTNIFTWKPKWEKTMELFSSIKTRLHPIELLAPTGRSLQPSIFTITY